MPQAETPAVRIAVELIPDLAQELAGNEALKTAVLNSIRDHVLALQQELGLAGELVLHAAEWRGGTAGIRWMKLRVNGVLCRYPDNLLPKIYCHVQGVQLHSGVTTPYILQWVHGLLYSGQGDAVKKFAEFFGGACRAILARDPRSLLCSNQNLNAPLKVLEQLLALRISTANVASTMSELTLANQEVADEDLAERLIAKMRPKSIEIQLPPDDLRAVTSSDPQNGRARFAQIRDELFDTLGITLPDFEFVATADLKRGSCRFRLNHVSGAPWPTIAADGLLVEMQPYALSLNPATGTNNAVFPIAAREQLLSGPPRVWNALEYVALCLGAEIRENAACFIDTTAVSDYLRRIDESAPVLVAAVRAFRSEEKLTQTLRTLVSDGISIRDVHSILNRILDFDYIVLNEQSRFVFDGRLPVPEQPGKSWIQDASTLAAFARSGLKQYLTAVHSGQNNTLFVYLLDAELESTLATESLHPKLDEEHIDNVLLAVREAMKSNLPDDARNPVVLTTAAASTAMRNLIKPELPNIPILAFSEVTASVEVQVLGRIALPSSDLAVAAASA